MPVATFFERVVFFVVNATGAFPVSLLVAHFFVAADGTDLNRR